MGTLYRNGIPYVGSGGAGGVEVTQAEYDALPTSEKMNGSIYFITDGSVSYPTASQMRYDNTESGIPSTSVQGAIDENRIEINLLNSGLTPTPFTGTVGGVTTTFYKFTIGGLIILAGVGAASSSQALGTRNIPIDISNGGITTLYGCSANISGAGDAMSYTSYVSGSAGSIDIWANFSANVSQVIYTFIAIGV